MSTPNEEIEKIVEGMLPKLCECIMDVSEYRGALWGKHIEPDEVPEYFKILLRTTLTTYATAVREEAVIEAVKEALTVVKLRIVYDRRRSIPPEETVQDIYDSIELKLAHPDTHNRS